MLLKLLLPCLLFGALSQAQQEPVMDCSIEGTLATMLLKLLLPCLLFGALSQAQQEPVMDCSTQIKCPINVYFTIDTSESIALQFLPPGGLVDRIKSFSELFVKKLQEEMYKDHITITWEFGGLHFSDRVEIYSQITSNTNEYIQRLRSIKYLGRGTFTDCALSNMTSQVVAQASPDNRVRFAVVITDGHVTGSPCGGMKSRAESARDAGIRLFAVSPSTNKYESGLREIANSPAELYRNNYQATRTTGEIHVETIDRIIKVMVSVRCWVSVPEEGEAQCPWGGHGGRSGTPQFFMAGSSPPWGSDHSVVTPGEAGSPKSPGDGSSSGPSGGDGSSSGPSGGDGSSSGPSGGDGSSSGPSGGDGSSSGPSGGDGSSSGPSGGDGSSSGPSGGDGSSSGPSGGDGSSSGPSGGDGSSSGPSGGDGSSSGPSGGDGSSSGPSGGDGSSSGPSGGDGSSSGPSGGDGSSSGPSGGDGSSSGPSGGDGSSSGPSGGDGSSSGPSGGDGSSSGPSGGDGSSSGPSGGDGSSSGPSGGDGSSSGPSGGDGSSSGPSGGGGGNGGPAPSDGGGGNSSLSPSGGAAGSSDSGVRAVGLSWEKLM
ncbi:UNVERIFIED_CONTAM: hypothetical protein FKN15_001225 [Acipenser sinensis]